ncbi:MAG: signal peptide peptidase SppA [Alphaproteobacteria bacterium]|nr:signal peptide peptidase SppA [Alphaproteobacteria bacterium]
MSWVLAPFKWVLARFVSAINIIFTLVALVILIAVLSSIFGSFGSKGLPATMVLTLDMRQDFTDQPSPSVFGTAPPSVIETIFALQKAESDPRVKGIYIRVGEGGLSYAHVQELRASLKALRAAGKFVLVHTQGQLGGGLNAYYLASAADQIWLQPGSGMGTSGIASYAMFLRGALENLKAEPEFFQREEYKNAANQFMERDFTPAHREAMTALLGSIFGTATAEIAADRGMTVEKFLAVLNGAPYISDEAKALKLVDELGFDDQAEKAAKDRAGEGAELTELAAYYKAEGSPYENPYGNDGVIALIMGEGAIQEGESGQPDPLGSDETSIGGDTLAKAFRDATEDKEVKAILFRVNSPGGSAIASDQILDAIRKAQAAGKPVIISMGPVAASGGYWVSMTGDKIFAEPTTITGSIGVLFGKVVFGGTYDWLGVGFKGITFGGPTTTMFNTIEKFTPEQVAAVNRLIDSIYKDFVTKVAEARGKTPEEIRAVAKGRVWSGTDAKARGLVDELGGFRDALGATIAMAGLSPDAKIHLRLFPAPKTPIEQFAELFGGAAAAVTTLQSFDAVLDTDMAQTLMEAADDADEAGVQARAPRQKLR